MGICLFSMVNLTPSVETETPTEIIVRQLQLSYLRASGRCALIICVAVSVKGRLYL